MFRHKRADTHRGKLCVAACPGTYGRYAGIIFSNGIHGGDSRLCNETVKTMKPLKEFYPDPWERQQGESSKAYAAFSVYRDMAAIERSVSKVARKCNKNASLLNRWSAIHKWVSRAAAWDNEVDRRAREDLIKGVTSMRQRHVDIASEMLVRATCALKRIPDDKISMADIARAVDVAAKLERLSRGVTTEYTDNKTEIAGKVVIESNPYEAMSTEELRELLRIARENDGGDNPAIILPAKTRL